MGDTFDSQGISRHGRPARKFRFGKSTIKAEEKAARPFIEYMDKLAGMGDKYVLTGNHEHWWAGVQDDYPGLMDTPWYELYGNLFDGWHVYAEHTALRFGNLLVCHGHRLMGALARNSAYSVLTNYPGQNTLYGHTHRLESCTRPTYKYGEPVIHGAWTIGHLRDIDDTLRDPALGTHAHAHQQGFAIVDFYAHGGFDVNLVRIFRDARGPYAYFRGKEFR